MLPHTRWSDRERHWARDWRALALTQVHHGSRTKRIPPRHVPNTGRYSSPLGKWPAADCARRLERPRVPRGSHRGTASVPGQLIAYLSPRGQLLAGMRALAPTRPRAHPRLRDRAWRTGRRDCVVLWCSIWCRAAIAQLCSRTPHWPRVCTSRDQLGGCREEGSRCGTTLIV